MTKTLLILAAGIGSRFGGGIKQLAKVGPDGEIIMDYSIHDAIKAGFNKIVIIIRKDIENDFMEVIGNRISEICSANNVKLVFTYQNMDNVPEKLREGRTKPWGTAHAILCCDGVIDEPFAVINADDYYGKDAFVKASAQLETGRYGLIGYILSNTLSENGGVSRGVCTVENGKLIAIKETQNIVKTEAGAESEGVFISPDSIVSMNLWCLADEFMGVLRDEFPNFLANLKNPLKDEYMLPTMVDSRIKAGKTVDVIPTDAKWFGVTYKEDAPAVMEGFRKLHEAGEYANELYSDI